MFGVKEVVYRYSADLANAFFHVCFIYLHGIVTGNSKFIKKNTFFMFGKKLSTGTKEEGDDLGS